MLVLHDCGKHFFEILIAYFAYHAICPLRFGSRRPFCEAYAKYGMDPESIPLFVGGACACAAAACLAVGLCWRFWRTNARPADGREEELDAQPLPPAPAAAVYAIARSERKVRKRRRLDKEILLLPKVQGVNYAGPRLRRRSSSSAGDAAGELETDCR